MERATVPTEGRPTMHPSWCDGGEPQVLREEAFPAGNVGGRVGAIAGWALFIVALCLMGVMSALILATAARADEPQAMTPQLYAAFMSARLICVAGKIHPRAAAVEHLSEKYGEEQAETVLLDENSIAELFTNPSKGTYTMLRTNTRGQSCVVGAGSYRPTPEPYRLGS